MWALDAECGPDLYGSGQGKCIRSLTQYWRKVDLSKDGLIIVSTLSERPGSKEPENSNRFELKSLILAQIERWRHALHMQVERQHGGNPGGEWRTGE